MSVVPLVIIIKSWDPEASLSHFDYQGDIYLKPVVVRYSSFLCHGAVFAFE